MMLILLYEIADHLSDVFCDWFAFVSHELGMIGGVVLYSVVVVNAEGGAHVNGSRCHEHRPCP